MHISIRVSFRGLSIQRPYLTLWLHQHRNMTQISWAFLPLPLNIHLCLLPLLYCSSPKKDPYIHTHTLCPSHNEALILDSLPTMESSKEIFQLGRTGEARWLLMKSRFYRISDAVITANKTTGAAGMQDGMPERCEMSHREESKSGLCDSQEGEQMCEISLLLLLHLTFFFFYEKIFFLSSSPERGCTQRIKDLLVPQWNSNPGCTESRMCGSSISTVWEFSWPGGVTMWQSQLWHQLSYMTCERFCVFLCRTIC